MRHLTIDDLSLGLVVPRSRVLELGTGDGRLSKHLAKSLKCFLVCVEKDKKNAQIARKYSNLTIVGDAENKSIQDQIAKKGKYDVIFASAFLAHLVLPDVFLKRASKWLKPGGFLIATFPNHSHWIIRKNLLFGKFDYAESGLYDRTHLHLFTISSARELLGKSGFKIEYFDIDPYGFWRLEKFFSFIPGSFEFLDKIYRMFPKLFAYQIIFKASLG